MYCYSNNGFSMRAVRDDYEAQDGEVLFTSIPSENQLSVAFPEFTQRKQRADIIAEIDRLEKISQTPRLIREAALGTDGGRLAALDEEISELRQQLYSA